MKGTVARNYLGTVPPKARVIVAVTYRDGDGRQLALPQSPLRESFTGLQLLTQQLLGDARGIISGWNQDFSIGQLGPSAFEIEVRAEAPKRVSLRRPATMTKHVMVLGLLEHLTDVLIDLGDVACFMAGHPTAHLRYIDGYHGPYYEFIQDGQAVKTIDARLLELLVAPGSVDGIRAVVANLKQPGVAYATVAKRVPGLYYVSHVQVPANEHLRDFANGGSLPFSQACLDAARAQALSEQTADSSSSRAYNGREQD